MQQRSSTSSSSRSSGDENSVINIAAEQQRQAKRRRNLDDDSLDGLPVYHLRNAAVKRDFSRPRTPPVEKWIHATPVLLLLLLCIFTLWWFSAPVNMEIKDGRITSIGESKSDVPVPNDNRIDITILAATTAESSSPIPSIPQNLSGEDDETYLIPASSPN